MKTADSARSEKTARGIVVIVLTVCAMSAADALIKYVSASFPLWQIYVLRSLMVMAVLTAYALLRGRAKHLVPRVAGWSVLRALLLAFMYIAIYAAAPVLSLATIAAALYTGPLFIALFSALLVGEPVGLRRWAAIGLGFAGVLVILRPGSDAFSALALIPVMAAILYALAAIITRAKCRDETPLALAMTLNLALLAVGTLASLLVLLLPPSAATTGYPFLFGNWITMRAPEWAVLSALALLMVGISIGLAAAYQSAAPSVIATFDYTYLLFAALWSYLIFSQPPDTPTTIGMIMIAAAGLLTIARPARRAPGINPR